jgi:nickel/cobalt exporter
VTVRAIGLRAAFSIGVFSIGIFSIGILAFALVAVDVAQAQPFGMARPPAAGGGDFAQWLLMKQAQFYRALSAAIRAAKADGSAAWGLMSLSFLYGVFHAAGPGHGKAVISSYLVANNETWRRGVVLSFASALLQALVAVLIVAIAAVLLGATAATMGSAVRWIEIVSYGLIALIGARLVRVKGGGQLRALRKMAPHETAPGEELRHDAVGGDGHDHRCSHGHSGHGDTVHDHSRHDGADRHHAGRACDHSDHASAWGHAHGPEPADLAGRGGWRRGLAAIIAVGLRPCSGAIIVLVFAFAQGIFLIGVGATLVMGLGTALTVTLIATLAVAARGIAGRLAAARPGIGMIALRGLETAAALALLVFGLLLLVGYLASERLPGGF